MDHLKCRKFTCLKNVFVAQCASYYYKKGTFENDYQTETLEEDIEDKDNNFFKEILNKTCSMLVLQYYKPNRNLYPEKFAYQLLLLYYPFLKEEDLLSTRQAYSGKLLDTMVCATDHKNKQIFEADSELIYTI